MIKEYQEARRHLNEPPLWAGVLIASSLPLAAAGMAWLFGLYVG